MPVQVIDKGQGNTVDLHPWFQQYGNLKIIFSGSNNTVRIPEQPRSCLNMVVELGNGCSVGAGAACMLSNAYIFALGDGHVDIGERSTFTSSARFYLHEPARITLGKDCMIASGTEFLASDMHTIYDLNTGRRTNPAADIEIADHVWIAGHCFILKGVKIGTGSVIGLRSTVATDIPAHCLAVGSPARVIRSAVGWDRKLWPAGETAAARGQREHAPGAAE
jgi:acetyltransferase-like isoleucine patch superfamily enzyme